MRYIFDEAGIVIGISLWYSNDSGWTDYYFVKNLQGDVLEVYKSSNHTLVTSYMYDSWGNILWKSGTLAEVNPFRYRSYYYDTETWFYYLQSRYYDPAIGRFINADVLVSTGQGLTGNNMFAYCLNNPANHLDPSGFISSSIFYPVCWGNDGYSLKTGPYSSADEAAQAFSEYVYSSSLYIRHEYGTEIYSCTSNGITQYYFNYPAIGHPHSVSVGYPVPEGATMVAYAHTHPNSNVFSPTDINVAKENNWDAYVVGPNHILQKFSLSTATITSLETITPRTLSAIEKAVLISYFSVSWENHISDGCGFNCKDKKWPFSEGE